MKCNFSYIIDTFASTTWAGAIAANSMHSSCITPKNSQRYLSQVIGLSKIDDSDFNHYREYLLPDMIEFSIEHLLAS
tara:strand:+ start:1362 stop:1592 length:231 start_codon:yes stop_codon:yes gene_type:complete